VPVLGVKQTSVDQSPDSPKEAKSTVLSIKEEAIIVAKQGPYFVGLERRIVGAQPNAD
jgi:hypothetical protein